jgi:transcriptional regulator with XRE-family HTH domain
MQNQSQAEAVRKFLRAEGISQTKLAELAQVSQSTVSRALRSTPAKHSAAHARLFRYLQAQARPIDDSWLVGSDRVLSAFGRISDGSEEHAVVIAKMIDATRGLAPRLLDTGEKR